MLRLCCSSLLPRRLRQTHNVGSSVELLQACFHTASKNEEIENKDKKVLQFATKLAEAIPTTTDIAKLQELQREADSYTQTGGPGSLFLGISGALLQDKIAILAAMEMDESWIADFNERVSKLAPSECEEFFAQTLRSIAPRPFETPPRVAALDFDIVDSEMKLRHDLERFLSRIDDLFRWHIRGKTSQSVKFLAPYFPLVQSSGTGKTKLLFEAKKHFARDGKTTCQLLVCADGNSDKIAVGPDHTYDNILYVSEDDPEKPKGPNEKSVQEKLWDKLDALLPEKGKVVLFFDESNLLTRGNAWYFRSVRWWLRKQRDNHKVVAVFSGTTSKLANFYTERASTNSRNSKSVYVNSGKELYEPFYELTTTGIAALSREAVTISPEEQTEYDSSIIYGRPLFARLHSKNKLERSEPAIISRMLPRASFGGSEDVQKDALFGILGTRFQMGQVSFDMASRLVASGYGSLSHFSGLNPSVADICYMPDPVCARLAMSLMIEGHSVVKNFDGRAPSFWTEKALQFFSTGLCRPNKGDVGETAAAMYLLFCGDRLRVRNDPELKHFSVNFDEWVQVMLDPSANGASASSADCVQPNQVASASVSFIQVCRNYFRHSLGDIVQCGVLKHWYKAGRALYTYSGCTAYDIVAPIRFLNEAGEHEYCPLLVSVKNRLDYSESERNAALSAMEKQFKKFGIDTGVAMLLMVGRREGSDLYKNPPPVLETFVPNKVACMEVVVPLDDPFGVDGLVRDSTVGGGERTEVWTSHAELPFLTDLPTDTLLRSNTQTGSKSFKLLDTLLREMRGAL